MKRVGILEIRKTDKNFAIKRKINFKEIPLFKDKSNEGNLVTYINFILMEQL